MQNDKIKEYWEGEAGIYSEGIKAELKSETAENWKNAAGRDFLKLCWEKKDIM